MDQGTEKKLHLRKLRVLNCYEIDRKKKEAYFFQPTVGISTNVFEAGFTSRLVWVNLDQAGNSSSGVFIEPVEPLNSDLKTLKLLLSLGFHTQ